MALAVASPGCSPSATLLNQLSTADERNLAENTIRAVRAGDVDWLQQNFVARGRGKVPGAVAEMRALLPSDIKSVELTGARREYGASSGAERAVLEYRLVGQQQTKFILIGTEQVGEKIALKSIFVARLPDG